MSETTTSRRIRAQPSPGDPHTLRFLLDLPVQDGAGPTSFDGAGGEAPLARALFAIPGVRRVEVDGACIHVRKASDARWEELKAAIAAAIRAVLTSASAPLGDVSEAVDRDAAMLAAVRTILDDRINPSIARHGGRISAERLTAGTVYLGMAGGCQGCAASQLTLRVGVERTLRAALPDLQNIVDLTDHDAGTNPFHAHGSDAAMPALSPLAATAAEAADLGAENEAPSAATTPLVTRIRGHLEARPPAAPTVSYGALARTMGLWLPGSVRKVTRALEDTMREDARTGRPFIAARAVSRAGDGLPGKGFFDLARDLSRGPREGETERAFHARELERLARAPLQQT